MTLKETLQKELSKVIDPSRIISSENVLEREADNTLGIKRTFLAACFPHSAEEVAKIIAIANQYRTPVHRISRGKNTGYGDKLPCTDNCILIDLSRMNMIRSFSPFERKARIEPGVTQAQLYSYLKQQDDELWMDVTGAGVDASVLGNALDGGFGHTPLGNRAEHISDLEIVLGTGEVITSRYPRNFIQTNFGVVTAASVDLFQAPEAYASFVISTDSDSGLERLIASIRKLREDKTLASLVHIANPMRTFISTQAMPVEYGRKPMAQEEAQELLSSFFIKAGYWNALGALYGTKKELKEKVKRLRAEFSDPEKHLRVFTDLKLALLSHIPIKSVSEKVKAYKELHGLPKGIPSSKPANHIYWRGDGLIWHSPKIEANPDRVRQMLSIAQQEYQKYHFELPVTLTFVKPEEVTATFSIHFNKAKDKQRAHALYFSLLEKHAQAGMHPYRLPVLGMSHQFYSKERLAELKELKARYDPNNIISPGRYGI